jgi:hypothetical protein
MALIMKIHIVMWLILLPLRLIYLFVSLGWSLHQLDVKDEFLHCVLKKEVYM